VITERLARSTAPVLITGETGTGKEVAALAIHNASGRSGAFVAINCAALPDQLAESELFGHARGAFTGATSDHAGAFERARGGTLLLDEIGDAPYLLQAKLLRALESGEVVRVGSGKPIATSARVLCATNVDLDAAVERGAFRRDLLHRIDVLRLRLPALRERDDFDACVSAMLARVNDEQGTSCTLADASWLRDHSWPGNFRELRNALTRWCVEHVEGEIMRKPLETRAILTLEPRTIRDVTEIQSRLIKETIRRNGGNMAAAARELGVNRTTLVEHVRKRHDKLAIISTMRSDAQ